MENRKSLQFQGEIAEKKRKKRERDSSFGGVG
jgi:hypothetical protein